MCQSSFIQIEVHLEMSCSVLKLDQYIHKMFSILGGPPRPVPSVFCSCSPHPRISSLNNIFLFLSLFSYCDSIKDIIRTKQILY